MKRNPHKIIQLMTGNSRLIKLSACAGIFGPLLFTIAVITLTIAQYDFMRSLGWDPLLAPTFDWPSGLSLGPLGWLMSAAFIASGAAMILFSFGLFIALPSKPGPVLMSIAGLALMGLAFTTDPTIRSTPASWHGRLHDLSFVLLGVSLIPAMIFLGRAFRQDAHWKNAAMYTWITAALAIPTFALKGAAFYVFMLAVLIWNEIIAMRLKNLQRNGAAQAYMQ